MATFEDLGLGENVLAAVHQMGYTEATPVQEQAIPLVLAGHDVIAAAQTGTGKTAAFTLPVLDKLGHFEKGHGPKALIVTPTRELAQQIDSVARTVAKKTGHYVLTVVGGVSYNPQINGLRRGIDVLVATPGRLLDLYDRMVLDLNDIEVLVLDEADRMLDMGFWPDVKQIIDCIPNERQTLLFSATIDDSVMRTIGGEVKDPQFVEIAHKGTAAETVEQFVIPTSQHQKADLLEYVLDEKGSDRVIIFTRTKSRAEILAERLNREGFSAEAIHGDRSQGQRSRALKNFKDGRVGILVATDVLARGIDVSDVDHVINFDVPMDPEDYIHRIGRTGRAGQFGWALTFVAEAEYFDLRDIEALMGKLVPDFPRAEGIDCGANAFVPDPDRKPTDKLPSKKARKKMLEQKAAAEAAGEAGRSVQSGVSQAGEARGGGRGHAKRGGQTSRARVEGESQAGEVCASGHGRSRGRAKQAGEGRSECETQNACESQGADGRSRTRGSRAVSNGRGRASGDGLAVSDRGDAVRGRAGEGGASGNRGRRQRTAESMGAGRAADERPASDGRGRANRTHTSNDGRPSASGRGRASDGRASDKGQHSAASANRSRRSGSARAATGQVRNAAAPKAASADPGAKPRRRPGDHGGYKRGL